jgi:iron(III) transport system ATP-binding protein
VELRLQNMVKEFGNYEDPSSRVVAVDKVSLRVEEGELVTLLGPSGCGKTTLLRMIAGFEDPTGGDIFFGERRMNDVAPNGRHAAMVFQSYAIFPHLDVFENIAFGLRLQNLSAAEIRERMAKVLELTGLAGLEQRQPNQLSGGQQQRVALARAIIMEPQLLLFDEPLSNLDAKLREQMRIELRALQQRLRITSVYVTHDQSEAMSISDRVVVMRDGRIEQEGTPIGLYSRPKNRFVAEFIGKANFLDGQVAAGGVEIGGQRFAVDLGGTGLREGDRAECTIRPEGIRIRDIGSVPRTPFAGTVRRSTFLGSVVEYEVSLEGLSPLLVQAPNPLEGMIHTAGSNVAVDFAPGALHVLASSNKNESDHLRH